MCGHGRDRGARRGGARRGPCGGEGGGSIIEASLATIARLSRAQAARLVDRDALSDADSGKIVVLYGGALHNDLSPSPEAARWSYAPELDAHVHGRFAAIDLVVPEFIGLDETWARLPWWPHYDRTRLGRKATLFRTGPQSFVLVFPVSRAASVICSCVAIVLPRVYSSMDFVEARNLPGHVGIIMDGNGRWAQSRGQPRAAGHREGAAAVRRTVRVARRLVCAP